MRVGMAAPLGAVWDQRLRDVGTVDAQRIFCTGLDDDKSAVVKAAEGAGRLTVVSTKVPGNDWAGAAQGKYDAQVKALPGSRRTVHHEPAGDGTASQWRAMQHRYAGIVDGYGPICNGFWWGAKGGLTDAGIAEYVGDPNVFAFVAGDFYESDRNQVADLLRAFMAWADRVGYRGKLAVGEIGCYTADSMRAAVKVLLDNHTRFDFVCWFNSERNSRADWVLSGDRLALFQAFVKDARALAQPPVDPEPVDPRDAQIADLRAEVERLSEMVRVYRNSIDERDVLIAQRDTTIGDYDHRLDTIAGIAARTAPV